MMTHWFQSIFGKISPSAERPSNLNLTASDANNLRWIHTKLSPTYAAPITVIVLIVVNPAQPVTDADVGWLRCGLLRHRRGRPLLLRLRCGGGLLLLNQLHWRRVLHGQEATDQALEWVTPRRHLRCLRWHR